MRINAALYEAQGATTMVAEAAAEGEAERVFDLIDTIARQILLTRAGGPSARFTRVVAVTTHSLPALKAYLEGERQFRAGHFERALEAFERGGGVGDPHGSVPAGRRAGGAPRGAVVGARSPPAGGLTAGS